MGKQKIIEVIEGLYLKKGAQIVSFDFRGKRRNVVVGSDKAYFNAWGAVRIGNVFRNRSGKIYMSALVNNEGRRRIRFFDVSEIENPSFA